MEKTFVTTKNKKISQTRKLKERKHTQIHTQTDRQTCSHTHTHMHSPCTITKTTATI